MQVRLRVIDTRRTMRQPRQSRSRPPARSSEARTMAVCAPEASDLRPAHERDARTSRERSGGPASADGGRTRPRDRSRGFGSASRARTRRQSGASREIPCAPCRWPAQGEPNTVQPGPWGDLAGSDLHPAQASEPATPRRVGSMHAPQALAAALPDPARPCAGARRGQPRRSRNPPHRGRTGCARRRERDETRYRHGGPIRVVCRLWSHRHHSSPRWIPQAIA